MGNVIGWAILVPSVFAFFCLLVIALCVGVYMAGGGLPIPPWNW